MARLLARLGRALSGPLAPADPAVLPPVPFPMLDGAVLACVDLAPHLARLPAAAGRRPPGS